MDLTKESIEQWLAKNYDGCRIIELDMKTGEQFFLLFRCKLGAVTPVKLCKMFMGKFSRFTLTNWNVFSSFPRMKRILYRKGYICQLTSNNKNSHTKSTKRNKDCTAKIELRFKKINRNTCRNDPYLREELNVVVKVNFHHSHSIRSLEAYSLLRCTPRTKKKYLEYFSMGLSPMDCRTYNDIYIRSLYYDPKQREIQLANGMVNVNQSKVFHLHYDWRVKNRNFKFDSFARLREEKEEFEAAGVYLKIIENPKIIVVLTPLTKKVFLEYGEEIFIHSSGCTGKDVQYVTSIFVPTKVGALPIGYILHDGNNEEEYEEGFKVFAASLREYCDDKPLRPKTVMTNDGEQLEELGRFFPRSSVDLCPYSNFSEFWTFIWCRSNNVHEEDRKRLMTKYYEILTSQSKNDCENILKELMLDPKVHQNQSLVALLDQLWAKKEEWCHGNVESIAQSEKDNKKLTSTHMRIYKDIVIKTIQKFNACALVKLFTGVIDSMYKRYLMQFAINGRASSPLYALFYDKPVNFNILPVGPIEYMVQSLTELDRVCTVYTDIIYCTCGSPTNGTEGVYCMHLCAVEYEFPFLPSPTITDEEKDFYNFPDVTLEVRRSIERMEESDDDDNDDKKAGVKNQIDDDYFDDIVYDDDMMDTIKLETVPIETSDSYGHIEINEDASAELVGLRGEVQRITQLLKTSKNKSRPMKRALATLKKAVGSSEEESPTVSVASTSKVKKQIQEATSTQDEESDIISKGWGMIYKRLRPKQQIYAKKAIDDILFEATLGTLARNSVVINQNALQTVELDPFQVKNESDGDDYAD